MLDNQTKVSPFYSLKSELGNGQPYDFAELKDKTVLVVNVASKCGFTPQYKGLQALYEKYKDRGLVILGFPCNQFGSQEPQDDKGVGEFCTLNYGVSFPIMKKSDVNGENTNEAYKWLKSEKPGILGLTRIKVSARIPPPIMNTYAITFYFYLPQWNFEKFLVDKNGKVVNRWASTSTPEAIDSEIAKIL
ncbi:hypothetical protein M378DRAFT_170222 [Amanita muscaria Koide BX008]|uniref:Glutathione peroxidase n=1 Tax=Amanita muscaria (strain Koide BX008) TaxID=946122 RepID=A0A0C2WPW7_AMAMK|nr:hypothetical protein M378DRAFT_170222 [Amanita muscaria Koide BX008]